jgi:hypothetical protein
LAFLAENSTFSPYIASTRVPLFAAF